MAFTVPLISAAKKIVHKSVFLARAQQRKRQASAGKPALTAPDQGEANTYWPLRMARLMLCTASTMAATDSGGVNWEIP
ncbi:hypothetical protein D3C72_1413670 [compost metagenome]